MNFLKPPKFNESRETEIENDGGNGIEEAEIIDKFSGSENFGDI